MFIPVQVSGDIGKVMWNEERIKEKLGESMANVEEIQCVGDISIVSFKT